MDLRNPDTGRRIKPRSRTHYQLVQSGKLSQDTLNVETTSVQLHARQRMPLVKVERFPRSTHFMNVDEIAEALHCSPWMLVAYFTKEFEEFKTTYHRKNITLIFPGPEPFIQDIVNDFVKTLKPEEGFNY